MAHNYVVTAHKPTAVNACVTGNLYDGKIKINDRFFYAITKSENARAGCLPWRGENYLGWKK